MTDIHAYGQTLRHYISSSCMSESLDLSFFGCFLIVIVVGVVKNQGVGQNQLRRTFSSAADARVGQEEGGGGKQNKSYME